MKKKIKDLTLGELLKICDESYVCEECPLYVNSYCSLNEMPSHLWKEDLEQEVEIKEEE